MSFIRFSTAIIIETAYGHQIVHDDDTYLKIAEDFCHNAIPALATPESSVIEVLPFCKLLMTGYLIFDMSYDPS